MQTLTGHKHYVNGIAVDPSNNSLLMVSEDKTLNQSVDQPHDRQRLSPLLVLACLSILTAKLYAGKEYAAGAVKKPCRDEVVDEEVVKGGGWQVGGRSMQGVLAFDSIASADVWR